MGSMRLLYNFRDEDRFRLRNAWMLVRAHPWDTLRAGVVTTALALFLASRIWELAPRVRSSLEAHPRISALVAGVVLLAVLRERTATLARRWLANLRTGWRRGFPIAPNDVWRAIAARAAVAAIPLVLVFLVIDIVRSGGRGGTLLPFVQSVAFFVAAGLMVVSATGLEARAWENGARESANAGRARSHRTLATPLRWWIARSATGIHRHLVELILRSAAPGASSVANGWGRKVVLLSLAVVPGLAFRGELAIVLLPIASLVIASFPPPGRLLWLSRHLGLSFGVVLRSHVLAAAIAVAPLWILSLAVFSFRPGARSGIAIGLLVSAAVVGWQILLGFAVPSSRLRRVLVTLTAAFAASLAWVTPGLLLALPVPYVLLAREALRVFRERDLVPAP
jgi:hypothetical protein